ncbi:MAG: hypothetical protein LBT55_02990 [Clostridiaceae bacterium]|jgi:hypothetical protein|nr:hypothetical protein [Clostridiaceae bacterium]
MRIDKSEKKTSKPKKSWRLIVLIAGIIAIIIVVTGVSLYFEWIRQYFAMKNSYEQTGPTSLEVPQLIANPQNAYEEFFNFRLEKFAPNTEPLITETFGDILRVEDEGLWVYPSINSAAIGFVTNLPALAVIEYGTTGEYGHVCEMNADSYYYNHLKYLRELEVDTEYHYRIKTQDYNGKNVFSADKVFRTLAYDETVIRIPEDMPTQTPPFTITKSGKYLLTTNIDAKTVFLLIKADNVTVDLGGHIVIYDQGAPEFVGTGYNDYRDNVNGKATFGIWVGRQINTKIYNGTIKQGANGGGGIIGHGFNPIYMYDSRDSHEVAGVTEEWYGADINGMLFYPNAKISVHHNVLYDMGTVITDRHQGIRAIAGGNSNSETSYCSLRRFRQNGLSIGGDKHRNELYSDSFDTNSFGISISNATATDNKLFGMGYYAIGFGWGNNIICSNNFVYYIGWAPKQRSTEFKNIVSLVAGIRYTIYLTDTTPVDNSVYEDNVIVIKPTEVCTAASGIWKGNDVLSGNTFFRRNTIKMEALFDVSALITGAPGNRGLGGKVFACIDTNGLQPNTDIGETPQINPPKTSTPDIYEDNTLISNVTAISFGSVYGVGSSAWFYRTKFERLNSLDENYIPISMGYYEYSSLDNRIIDSICGGGVDFNSHPWGFGGGSSGFLEVTFGSQKNFFVRDAGGSLMIDKTLTVTYSNGRTETFETDANGCATVDIFHYQFWYDFRGQITNSQKDKTRVNRVDYDPPQYLIGGQTVFVTAVK